MELFDSLFAKNMTPFNELTMANNRLLKFASRSFGLIDYDEISNQRRRRAR